jgi:cytoskeletal protein CcmA (bactofilin family)
MPESNKDIATTIGQDAVFKGELRFDKSARLLGRIEGQVHSKGQLDIAEGASLEGEVNAGDIRVEGSVKGNLRASGKVLLAASAKLEGDLATARLEVAEGAVFVGRCTVGKNGAIGDGPPPPGDAGKGIPAKDKSIPQPNEKK